MQNSTNLIASVHLAHHSKRITNNRTIWSVKEPIWMTFAVLFHSISSVGLLKSSTRRYFMRRRGNRCIKTKRIRIVSEEMSSHLQINHKNAIFAWLQGNRSPYQCVYRRVYKPHWSWTDSAQASSNLSHRIHFRALHLCIFRKRNERNTFKSRCVEIDLCTEKCVHCANAYNVPAWRGKHARPVVHQRVNVPYGRRRAVDGLVSRLWLNIGYLPRCEKCYF